MSPISMFQLGLPEKSNEIPARKEAKYPSGVVAIRKITQQCFGFCCAIAEIFGRNISVSEERVHFTHA